MNVLKRYFLALSLSSCFSLLLLFGCFGDKGDKCGRISGGGEVKPQAILVIEPEAIDFGSVVINPLPAPVSSLLISNQGDATLILYGVFLSEDSAPSFSLMSPPIEDFELEGGSSIEVLIQFAPQEVGPATGFLIVRSSDPERPEVLVPLSGQGIAPPINEIPLGECINLSLPAYEIAKKNFVVAVESNLLKSGICSYLTFAVENPDPPEADVVLHVRYGEEVVFDPYSGTFLEDASGAGLLTLTVPDLKGGLYFVLAESKSEVMVSFDLCAYFTEGGVAFRRGYLDGDDQVRMDDVLYLLNYLFLEGPAPSCIQAADTNGDCRLTVSDGVRLLRYLFDPSGPGVPPPPFEECGCPEVPCDIPCLSFPLCEETGLELSTFR